MDEETLTDKIVGAILGIFIGDALGMGVHWQYDLDKLERERGYVTDYLDPLPGTYHSGTADAPGRGALQAGELEQQGAIAKVLLESLVENHALDQNDFHERLEKEILRGPGMDGTRQGGTYGWTDKSICELYHARVALQKDWKDCIALRSDGTDSIIRGALIATLYSSTPREMCCRIQEHAKAITGDSSVQAHAVAFGCLLAGVLQGQTLDQTLSMKMYSKAGAVLPFSSMYSEKDWDETYGKYSEPDPLLWFGQIAGGVETAGRHIEPPHRGVELYGKFCAFFAVLPSAYYCVSKFPSDFEKAVLCSVNGGGQTTMRTSLVGALVGAHVGLSGIPKRFVDGLDDHKHVLGLARSVAEEAMKRGARNQGDQWDWAEGG